MKPPPNPDSMWDAARIKALRLQLKLSQASMAERLGTRQQTVSEWETCQYEPRGTSVAMLNILAEQASAAYRPVSSQAALSSANRRRAQNPSRRP